MRIVSLLPAATEWICAFGGEALLVGRSHACDYPASIQHLPVVTQVTGLDAVDAAALDAQVRTRVQQGLSLYDVDLEMLRTLQPDLIVTQAQCEVCAVSLTDLEALLARWTGARPEVFSMEPMTLKGVFDAALRLGQRLGLATEAMRLIGHSEMRLRRLHDRLDLRRTADPETFPTVACIEWLAPLMTAGHWMPDLVEQVGLRAVLATRGTRSAYITFDDLRAADPEAIAIMPCGYALAQTRANLHHLQRQPGWNDLQAVRHGHVSCFDGNAYFNRPGPRLYRAFDVLAMAFFPDRAKVAVEPWEMQWLDELPPAR